MGPPKVEGVAPSAASQSRPCHGRVSGCKSRRSRHFSRRRQAAKAPGLHPGIPGVRVPPSRPLSFWCGRQARHRAVNSTHEGALPSTRATIFRDIAQQQSAPFGTVRSQVQTLLSRPLSFRDRLIVGHAALDRRIVVRVHVPEPAFGGREESKLEGPPVC